MNDESTDQTVAVEYSAELSEEVVSSAASEDGEPAAVPEDIDWPKFKEEDLDTSLDGTTMTTITLDNTDITVEGKGLAVTDTTLIITAAGTYQITGDLNDGQIT